MAKKKLTPYADHQAQVFEQLKLPEPSGVACPEVKSSVREKDCPGEMMIQQPPVNHESLKHDDGQPFQRAVCSVCRYRGWA